jgi:membrane associated rhomboid family serine protease
MIKIPTITKNILIINAIAFLATSVLDKDWIISTFGLYSVYSPNFHYVQFLTHMFLHGGFFHIFLNMIVFMSFAPYCELKLGPKKFLAFYLISGFIGAMLNMITVSPDGLLIGASGAVFGVLFLYVLNNLEENLYLYLIFPMKAKYVALIILFWEIYAGFFQNDNIAHFAHIGGAFVGITYGLKRLQNERS